ncbi:hypothetical protein EMPG_16861 [Blastomyces silverae]|uniref:Uncharacterized protein n=1 Tax=Blastomyces silverae TaxID=2060906 RepID=A0A0H1BEM0_9EURO|nr:hypothetical protein EMPG_16861 [Blastomyces silverae]
MRPLAVWPLQMLPRRDSYTMLAATSSFPTTNTSTIVLTRPCPRRTTGTLTSASRTSAARASGSPTLSKTTSPCFPRRTRSNAWMG